jgi:hypothetical protein
LTAFLPEKPGSMLLSLVVIFTQSIQLSKIVERLAYCCVAIAPLGGLSIPAQGSTSAFAGDSTSSRFRLLVRTLPIEKNGGADRDRTDDILLAKQALSQLSYSPIVQ